jgi:Stage II sporulation protein E (SpoIIE)
MRGDTVISSMSAGKVYWKTLPKKSTAVFLLGVFLIFSTVGIASDIIDMGRQPQLRFSLSVLLSGLFPMLYAFTGFLLRGKFWKAFIPLFAVHFMLMNLVARSFPDVPQAEQLGVLEIARLHSRLSMDGMAIIAAVALGYTCFVYVSITEARRYFRIHAEVELATEIHQVLVPAIDTSMGGYEFYGKSVPSGEVGGDLIDLAGSETNWVAYLADVSGHGVAPGVVMGMTKSASRMLLSSGDDSEHLMTRLNAVLFPLKKPDMFVTFCFVSRSEEGLRVGLAGHPAILHFCGGNGDVIQVESGNMPLGILPDGDFSSSEIQAGSGDVFMMYTDGFVEPANASGEEFGIKRLQEEFKKLGREPLEQICHSLQQSVAQHGAQFDDQSILLIRKM